MSETEKITLCQALIPDANVTTEEISAYLSLALQRIADRLYPFGTDKPTIPSRYDSLQCELAVRMMARRGGEGEVNHSENGISRTWANVDDADLLDRVVPFVGV